MRSLRHALRSVARTPGFSVVLIAIIALGIGANTAIFSVVRAVLLRPLPLHEPERLVRLYEAFDESEGAGRASVSPQMWVRWRELNDVFTDIGAATNANYTLTDGSEGAERVPGALPAVLAGLLTGLSLIVIGAGFVQFPLFDTSARDPVLLSLAMGVLAASALLACWLPARRAARVSPLIALRSE